MNPNPNLNFNVIKGLQILIGDIRACHTREDEAKRVESELDKIRGKFSNNKVLTGYDKKKYVWKLIYIYILGYEVDFGHNYAADLITSTKFSEKITGYIAMSILFKEDSSEISIMINSIKNDLLNNNPYCQSMALSLAANLNNKELLKSIEKETLKYLTNYTEKQPNCIKKALIVLMKITKYNTTLLDCEKWGPLIIKLANFKNYECLLSLCSLTQHILITEGTSGYEKVAEHLLANILLKMKDTPEEYIYYHIKCPWLQIKIIKILTLFPVSSLNSDSLKHVKEYADYMSKKTQGIIGAEVKYSRYYAEYCMFFETISFIDYFSTILPESTFITYINLLGIFLSESRKYPNKDINTKYLALDGLAKLSKYSSGNLILKNHSNVIIASLHDSDLSIRRKALELMFLVCTKESVKQITKEMLLYYKENEPQLKEDIALKVAILAEKYAVDLNWYIDCILKMIELAGEYVSEDIVYRFYQLMKGFENQPQDKSVQIYSVEKILKLLDKDVVNENTIKLGSMILGEFAYLCENIDYFKSLSLLKKHIPLSNNTTVLSILSAIMKLVKSSNDDEIKNLAVPILEEYLESWDPELQQRAVEYLVILKYMSEDNHKNFVNNVFKVMPSYNIDNLNNSVLMKKLSKTDKNLYSKTKEGKNTIQKEITKSDNSNYNNNLNEYGNKNYNIRPSKNNEMLSELLTVEYDNNHPFSNHIIYKKNQTGFAPSINIDINNFEFININFLSYNYNEFKAFLTNINNAGCIYKDDNTTIDIKLKSLSNGVLGALLDIKFLNSVSFDQNLELIEQNSEGLEVMISKFKYLNENNAQVLVKLKLIKPYTQPITFKLSNNNNFELNFALPVLINKYIDVFDCSIEDYSSLWLEFSNTKDDSTQRFDTIMKNPMDQSKSIMDFLKKLGGLLNSLGFKVFSPNDINNYHEIEIVGVLPKNDNINEDIPILIQASFVPSYKEEFRLSIRSKSSLTSYYNLGLNIYSIIRIFINPNK